MKTFRKWLRAKGKGREEGKRRTGLRFSQNSRGKKKKRKEERRTERCRHVIRKKTILPPTLGFTCLDFWHRKVFSGQGVWRKAFSASALSILRGWKSSLLSGCCPVNFRMLCSTPALYLLDASSHPLSWQDSQNISGQGQTSPGKQNHPWLRTTGHT